ncbi:alginate lyase family protein [Prosthecomicrobium pneumaticum]|uniref:Poly(Beta-D-mannuronate) lyase n=1 Tax=Prosthecomicrobium pneumaticum TaxID=81895 RepID=A0A7W9L427_9HYPH|nr:alginate lyase family protein [Prosthecomicrobium pneumaticum]MBB5755153.1 poly(beta-D-mannuronate) lyase [Prosthecomicrobium pneumaticum]
MTMDGNPFRQALRLCVLALLVAVMSLVAVDSSFALLPEERARLDLSVYRVKDRAAGYFDVKARRAALLQTRDHLLRRLMADIRKFDACPAARGLTVIAGDKMTPRFYDDRDGWRLAASPYHTFEDAMSRLAARQLVAPESGAGDCLLDVLVRWAQARAFLSFAVERSRLQTWFQIESSLFAAAFAYSIVRDDVPGRDEDKAEIERWLVAAAKNHLRPPGDVAGSCCNNHFYRRALYSAMIGVLTGDDYLFRLGVSAVYSAIADSAVNGALPLEMKRQQYAARYQVYATMALVFIAEVAARQGYDLYSISGGDRSLSTVVDFSVAAMLNPEAAAEPAKWPGQDDTFLEDRQFYGWLELVGRKRRWQDAANALLASERPSYNRALGGFVTLYFLPLGR